VLILLNLIQPTLESNKTLKITLFISYQKISSYEAGNHCGCITSLRKSHWSDKGLTQPELLGELEAADSWMWWSWRYFPTLMVGHYKNKPISPSVSHSKPEVAHWQPTARGALSRSWRLRGDVHMCRPPQCQGTSSVSACTLPHCHLLCIPHQAVTWWLPGCVPCHWPHSSWQRQQLWTAPVVRPQARWLLCRT